MSANVDWPRLSPEFEPPYYAVIFTSIHNAREQDGYAETAAEMVRLAAEQDGFLGLETTQDEAGVSITVSYWRDEVSIQKWKAQSDHAAARQAGRDAWYLAYRLRVAKVERAYGWEREGSR